MKYLKFVALFLILTFWSCDDGDIILSDFNFDADSPLKVCQIDDQHTMYIINTDPDEAISFTFSDADFDGTLPDDQDEDIKTVQLSGGNPLVYRAFDGHVSDNYFCAGIPSTNPQTTNEYKADNGTIEIITAVIEQDTILSDSTITKTFLTRAIGHNLKFKKSSGSEEIIRETLKLGFYKKTKNVELE